MKYRILLTLYIVLVQGQVNRNFWLVLNEMGPGRTSPACYFHSPGPCTRYCTTSPVYNSIVFTFISPQLYLLLSLPNCIYYYLSLIKSGIMNFWTSNQWNHTPLDPFVCHNLGKSTWCKSYVGQAVFVGRLQLNLFLHRHLGSVDFVFMVCLNTYRY